MDSKISSNESIFLNQTVIWRNFRNFAFHMTHLRIDILTRLLHWLLRFRKRCGYGIHSPFAFGFVTGVIYEKGEYYAYSRLPKPTSSADCDFRLKDLRLMLRLMNYQRPASCLCVGEDEPSAESLYRQYMQAGSIHTKMLKYGSCDSATSVDMIFGQHQWMQSVLQQLPRLSVGGMVLVHDICSTCERQEAWTRLKAAEQSTVTFDLRDFGIVFYRPELQRQDYVVNYF